MAVARFANSKPLADTDTLLYTIERTALTSLVAVNVSGFTNISAWIVPAGEDENPENWIYYVDNVGLTNRNSFETFRIAVNVGDQIYVKSTSGEVTFFINGIYDVTGRANVTTGPQEPESPQIGDVWINEDADPRQIYYWDGSIWMPLGTTGPANVLTIGTVETGEFGDPAEVTIEGDSPEQVLNFVLPPGQQGPANVLAVGTVTTSDPGEDAEVEITGTSPEQTINFVLPRGEVGPIGPTGPAEIDYPDQAGNEGKFLTTDGTDPFWEVVDALPSQTGNEGKYLTTDGTDPEWAFLSGGSAGDEPPATGLVDGSIWLDTDGEVPPSLVDLVRWNKVAIAEQNTFTGAAEGGGTTLSYVPGNEQVFLNGVQLIRGLDYSANDGEAVVLSSNASAGDILQIIILPAIGIIDSTEKTLFEAKGDILAATSASTPTRLAVGPTGTFLKADASTPTGLVWEAVEVLPSQDTNAGKFLTTNGTVANWEDINLQSIQDNLVLNLMGAI
jgi:hypothetical protein